MTTQVSSSYMGNGNMLEIDIKEYSNTALLVQIKKKFYQDSDINSFLVQVEFQFYYIKNKNNYYCLYTIL